MGLPGCWGGGSESEKRSQGCWGWQVTGAGEEGQECREDESEVLRGLGMLRRCPYSAGKVLGGWGCKSLSIAFLSRSSFVCANGSGPGGAQG